MVDDQDNDQPANENITPKESDTLASNDAPDSSADNEDSPPPAEQMPTAPPAASAPAAPTSTGNFDASNPIINRSAPNEQQFIDKIAQPTEQELNQHDIDFAKDVLNKKITPKTYHDLFANKDTLPQLGLAFSILAGGIGSGLTHQSNAALDMMNNIINRDFEAQKNDKENANTFLRTEYDHQSQLQQQKLLAAQTAQIPFATEKMKAETKHLNADTDLVATNAGLNKAKIVGTFDYLKGLVDKTPEGPQKQVLQQALNQVISSTISDVGQRNAQTAAQLNARSALRNPTQANPQANAETQFSGENAGLVASGMPELANYRQEHHYPGLGDSSQPITSADKEKINSGIGFQNELQGFINWSRAHSGSLNPAEINEGQALAAQLQSAYRTETNGGVYKEGEQHFINKIISDDPTKFFNEIRSIPQLNAIQRETNAQLNTHLKSLGFQNKPKFEPTWNAEKNQKAAAGEGGVAPDGTKGIYKGKPYTWKNGQKVID